MTRTFARSGAAAAMLVTCAFVWGSNAVVGRALHEDVPPVGLSFWRNVFGLAVLLPFTARELVAGTRALRGHLRVVAAAGIVGTALFNVLLYLALHTTTAIQAALTLSLSPVVIPLLAFLLLGHRLTRRQALGIALSLAGVVLLLTRGNVLEMTRFGFHMGDVLALLAALCWALYSVVVPLRPAEIQPLPFLTLLLAVAALVLLPFYVWESLVVQPMPAEPVAWLAAAYVGIFPTAVALLLFNRAVDWIGPTRAGLYTHLVPVFSTLLAIALLGERFEWFQLAGALPIAGGLYLATTQPASTRAWDSKPRANN